MIKTLTIVAALVLACGAHDDPTVAGPLFRYHLEPGTPQELEVHEISRQPHISVLEVSAHQFGGAVGGSLAAAMCAADIAEERGRSHFVVLSNQITRHGDASNPGNDGQMVVGFSDGASAEDLEHFPGRYGKPDPADVAAVEMFRVGLPGLREFRTTDG